LEGAAIKFAPMTKCNYENSNEAAGDAVNEQEGKQRFQDYNENCRKAAVCFFSARPCFDFVLLLFFLLFLLFFLRFYS